MNLRGRSNDKLKEVLDLLGLSADERCAAEAFYAGEAEQKEPPQLAFQDLSAVAPGPVDQLAKELVRKKRTDELARLFLLVFARGQSTCCGMFTTDDLKLLSKMPEMDKAKLAAVYSEKAGTEPYPSCSSVTAVFDAAGHSTKTVRRAVEYMKGSKNNGRLILLATYFRVEYQNRKPFLKAEKEGNPQAYAKAGGVPQVCTEVEAEDIPLLSSYEKIAVETFARLYFGCVNQPITEAALQELDDAAANGRMPEKLSPLAGAAPRVGDLLQKLTVGLCYWNYMLSDKLKNIVKFCLAVDWKKTLEAMYIMSMGLSIDLAQKGGEYDAVFGIDTETYLRWAVERNFTDIMKKQFEIHPECYLKLMRHADVEQSGKMLSVVRQQDSALYEKIMRQKRLRARNGNNADREKLIADIVPTDQYMDAAKAYLRGESTVETLYPYADLGKASFSYAGGREWMRLADYMKVYEDEEFFRRCEAYMLLKRAVFFFRNEILVPGSGRETVEAERAAKIFADFTAEGIGLSFQLSGVFAIYDGLYVKKLQDAFLDAVTQVFEGYLKERREEMLAAFAGADAFGRYFALRVMRREAQENKKEILAYAQDSAKMVKQELFDILCAQRDWEEDVKRLLSAKKAAEKEMAVRVLLVWQKVGADFGEFFAQAFEKEKNAKIKELLGNALGDGENGAAAAPAISRAELVKELHRGGKKRGLAWAYETPFSAVHTADGGAGKAQDGSAKRRNDGAAQGTQERAAQNGPACAGGRAAADEEYLQAILLCYASKEAFASAEGCGVSKNAAFLAEGLDAAELAVYVNELFDKWLAAGAEAKKRWVLYAAAIHGGSAIVEKLQHQIREWPQQARGAIACEAVKALSLNPLPQALLIVDGIARKFKFKQVRAAAGEALEFAAQQLGITREELADRIVPDFGFDERVERVFDYGERKFIVTLTTALEIEVFEAAETPAGSMHIARGKKLKNLPAPGRKDDGAKAAAAYEEFKQLKKQLKTTVSSQKQRLETALSTAREWTVDAWRQLFVKNPIMHQFAIGLIWGIYEEGKLAQSFRYMEDGSFNTEDEEEFALPDYGELSAGGEPPADGKVPANAKIGLVHPIELTEESKAAWKEQLSDYEISQPFEQLDRAVYAMTEEEADTQELARFQDNTVNDLSLGSRLSVLGWYRGSVQDAGCFDTYYREDPEIGFGVELHFSGSYVGGENAEVTVYGARFYKAGTVARGSYVYDEADKEKAYFLRDVPARYFSEIVWQLTKAVASGKV